MWQAGQPAAGEPSAWWWCATAPYFACLVTLVADAVALGAQLQRMRLVAVAAGDALREHLALAKRGVVVDLVQHLAVGLEQARLQQGRHVRLEELLAGAPAFGDPGAAGMADAAGLELLGAGPRRAARGVAGGRVDRPVDALALVEVDREPVVAALAPGQPALLPLGPGDVGRAGTVAGLAGDIDLGPGGRVGVRGRIVVLAQLGRVALGAHEVPGLIDAGPVQRIAGVQVLVGVEVEPALAALILRAARPRRCRAPAGGRPGRRSDIAAAGRRQTCSGSRSRRACRPARRCVTKNLPSRRKKREVTSPWVKLASSKSPSTVSAVASCIARSWCDPRHAAISLSWHPPQAALPTNVGASAGCAAEAAPQTTIVAPTRRRRCGGTETRQSHRQTASVDRRRRIAALNS